MKSLAPPLVSSHRLARILTWARLWLVWAAGVMARFVDVLPEAMERNARAQLDRCAEIVARVIFLSAFARIVPPASSRQTKEPAGSRRSASLRALTGAALRRALRGKDVSAKLAALADVVRKSETHIAKLARRLARGLTRRRVFAFAAEFAPRALAASRAKLLHADSS